MILQITAVFVIAFVAGYFACGLFSKKDSKEKVIPGEKKRAKVIRAFPEIKKVK